MDLSQTCTPLYEPNFANVYADTLAPSCAVTGTSCHASEGLQGGLDFGEIDRAHESLRSVIEPSDVACSPILARLESTEIGFGMPPGRRLSEAERCAIRMYIEAGAPR